MQSPDPWPTFPQNLEPPAARRFSLLFILQELIFSFAQKEGAFDRLCFYSEILLQASNVHEKKLPLLLEEMKSAYFFKIRDELYEKLRSFFFALIPYLFEAREDENVLFYLVEQKKQLNQHLGAHTMEELFRDLFPTGLAELKAAICEGYTRRGFASFLAQQKPLIDDALAPTYSISS